MKPEVEVIVTVRRVVRGTNFVADSDSHLVTGPNDFLQGGYSYRCLSKNVTMSNYDAHMGGKLKSHDSPERKSAISAASLYEPITRVRLILEDYQGRTTLIIRCKSPNVVRTPITKVN